MLTSKHRTEHRRWLKVLTGIPTAAACEDRVIEWVRDWVGQRRNLTIRADAAGNLVITRRGDPARPPIFMTAHLDHPAFVVRRRIDDRTVELEFRGGVHDPYFAQAKIEIFDADGRPHRAVVTRLDPLAKPFKRVEARLRAASPVQTGDVARWAFRGRGAKPTIVEGMLYTPACDDLAGVAAALSTLDVLRTRKSMAHVGVLLTRAEEIGFVGAIAACKRRTIPRNARLICIENSRSFPESPIGAGPILRVGDKLSVFSPDLTNRLSMLLGDYQRDNPRFKAQRKLMPGGTCEASTFAAYGYQATCVCLPLGNYHNMVDIDGVLGGKRPARVGPEQISMADYHGLVELLVHFTSKLDVAPRERMVDVMDGYHRRFGALLQGSRQKPAGGSRAPILSLLATG
ncbi:MAG: hypothetical protein E2O40_00075 [Planctomycetota bacterium]|nr:MAG: hypothetical protein E2O40_00075 [Planctomycetota bacterium]